MSDWPKILHEQHGGDPFLTLFEFGGKRYIFNEAALIEAEEQMHRAFEMDFRLKAADGMRRWGLPW